MEGLLRFNDLATDGNIVTVEEMSTNDINSARERGWSLLAVFEAEKPPERYSSDPGGKVLFGVYTVPMDGVIVDATKKIEELESEISKQRTAAYKAEQEAKEVREQLYKARETIGGLEAFVKQHQQQSDESETSDD